MKKKLIVAMVATAAITMLIGVAQTFAATTCWWISYQPQLPQKETN